MKTEHLPNFSLVIRKRIRIPNPRVETRHSNKIFICLSLSSAGRDLQQLSVVCLTLSHFLSELHLCWQEDSGALIPNSKINIHVKRGSEINDENGYMFRRKLIT
jgi:hypothetical protein